MRERLGCLLHLNFRIVFRYERRRHRICQNSKDAPVEPRLVRRFA